MIGSFRKAGILRGISGRFIDRVITVSVDNRKHLVEEHGVDPDKIRVVYNGIPDLRGRAGAMRRSEKAGSSRGMEIIMVGALEERKGHRLMIDAMADLPDDVFLSIIGEGELAASLAKFAEERKVDGRVRFSGYRDDVASIMAEADLLVLPTALDAAPYVVLEALSSGLPVVASGIFGLPELIRDGRTGILTAPGDREGLLKAVRRMYAEPGLRARMSESCRSDYLERFTIGKSVLATMAVYDELF
jgi:glycosyltransferase involved in cell wall biosynthesis